MELKLSMSLKKHCSYRLLIVPYGIETRKGHRECHQRYDLLIVPYGIETSGDTSYYVQAKNLLIVPYGIETCFTVYIFALNYTFNCTLWN